MENTDRNLDELANSLVSLAIGEKVEEERCVLPQYRTTMAQKHEFAKHVAVSPRNRIPIEWVIDIADEFNNWFYGTAYHYDDSTNKLHVMVPDKQNPTFDGHVLLDYRAVHLIECVDGKSDALFNRIVRDSVVKVSWSVEWFEESEDGQERWEDLKGSWITTSARYYIRIANQLLVGDKDLNQEFLSFVIITADLNLKLLKCHEDEGKEDFVRLIKEGIVQSSPEALEVAHAAQTLGGALVQERIDPGDVERLKEICKAVKTRNVDILTWLLTGLKNRRAFHYEERHDSMNMTALMIASHEGDMKMVGMLVEAGADVNHQDTECGCTALICAARQGRIIIVQALLEKFGAKVDMQDKEGWTALIWAANNGHLSVVRILLECGADKSPNWDGITAAGSARDEKIRTLIDTHVYPSKTPNMPAASAASSATAASSNTSSAATQAEEGCADDPVLPSPAEVAAAVCAALEGECDTLGEQVAQAPARRDLMQKRNVLLSQFNAARAVKPVDYAHVSTLGESLEALKQESAKVNLSEEDYLTLVTRHAALVQKVEAKCEELLENNLPDLLDSLADKLTEIQSLNTADLIVTHGASAVQDPPVPHNPAELQRLLSECDAVKHQALQAPKYHELTRLNQELQAVKATKPVNYKQASELLKLQNELRPQVQLSEEDYLTLAVRHAALVQRVQGMCEDLVAARQYRLLRDLAVQLTALRALDLSFLSAGTTIADAGTAASDCTVDGDDGYNDPVWVEDP